MRKHDGRGRVQGMTRAWCAERRAARAQGGEAWEAWQAAHPGGVPTAAEVDAAAAGAKGARAAAMRAARAQARREAGRERGAGGRRATVGEIGRAHV